MVGPVHSLPEPYEGWRTGTNPSPRHTSDASPVTVEDPAGGRRMMNYQSQRVLALAVHSDRPPPQRSLGLQPNTDGSGILHG